MGTLAAEIRATGAEIAGIAVTATFSQMAFAASLGVDFPLLSDWDATVCGAYGVRYDSWKGHRCLAKRSLFVVDRRRVVRYRWHEDDALVSPDLAPLIGILAALER